VSFSIGEKVLLFDPFIIGGHLNKLSKRFSGPYTLLEQKSPPLYKLDFKPIRNQTNVVHVWRMKRYFDMEDFIEKFENSFVDKSAQHIDIDSKSFQKFDLNKLKSKSIDQNLNKSISYKENNSHFKNLNRKSNKMIEYKSSSSDSSDSESNASVIESSAPSSPNYSTNHGLRRSVRIRRPVNRLNLYFSTIMCVFCLMHDVNSLATMDPIIWQKMKNPVVEGVETVTTVINYSSPCHLFSQILIDRKATDELKTWCELQFKTDFIDQVNGFCTDIGPKDSIKFGLIRNKRFVFVGALAVFTLVTIIASVGIGASALIFNVNSKDRISAMEEDNLLAIKHINQLKGNAHIEKQILTNFNSMLQNLTGEVLELKQNVALIKQTVPKAMRATSLITTRLHFTRNTLTDIARDFRNGKLNIKFMDLFNYTIACGDKCPPEYRRDEKNVNH
jgi:hypothetical protein